MSKHLFWTEHAKAKMRQYALSKTRLIQMLYTPERKEAGIVPGTVAVMRTNKLFRTISKKMPIIKNHWQPKKVPGEVWLMYKDDKDLRKIISAWRYPGVSKPGESIPVPEDIRQELLHNHEYT